MRRLLLLSLILSGLLAGCVSPRAAAYKSLASVGYAVDGAMKAFAKAVAYGQVDDATKAKIIKLHDEKFNPTYRQAILAAKMDYTKAAPEELAQLAADLIATIDLLVHPKGATP